jgi:hypothetical protein
MGWRYSPDPGWNKHRLLDTAWLAASRPLGRRWGLLVNRLFAAFVNLLLSPAAVGQWGWRLAFVLAAVLGNLWATGV